MKRVIHPEPGVLPDRPLCREYFAVYLQQIPVKQVRSCTSLDKLRIWGLAAHASGACELLGLWTVPSARAATWERIGIDLQFRGVEKVRYLVGPDSTDLVGSFPNATVLSSATPLLLPRRRALAGVVNLQAAAAEMGDGHVSLPKPAIRSASGDQPASQCEGSSVSLSPRLRHVAAQADEAVRSIQAALVRSEVRLWPLERAEEWDASLWTFLLRLSRPWIKTFERSVGAGRRSRCVSSSSRPACGSGARL